MSEFWLWFTRPFAETTGSIALLVGLFLFAMAGLMVLAATSWVYWFTRPFAETAGSIALLVGLFLFAMSGLMVMAATSWVYYWVRRKIQDMWSGGGK